MCRSCLMTMEDEKKEDFVQHQEVPDLERLPNVIIESLHSKILKTK